MPNRLIRFQFALAACFAACLFAACDDGSGDPPTSRDAEADAAVRVDGDTPDPICEAERRRCTDDGVEVCVGGAGWVTVGPCPGGTECRDGMCVEPDCMPDCQGRICGSDGCAGSCGECEPEEVCSLEGRCDPPPPRCGDDVCNGEEDCATCPADCGSCCGDGTCDEARGESCTTCPADCGCEAGEVCDAGSSTCEACAPQCEGRACGDDGCGGVCGMCDGGVACVAGRCDAPCVPQCAGRECGGDGCGGACGACGGGEVCTAEGRCGAAPAQCGDEVCDGDEDCSTCPADCGACCGDGLCAAAVGEDCSTCPADCGCPGGQACNVPVRRCEAVCAPQCAGRNCGADGCGGACGQCLGGQECAAGVCRDLCQPACAGRQCGGDGCGGSCGLCPAGQACTDGACEAICSPNCAGRVCGPDGCGGFCGNCGIGAFCTVMGRCEAVCVPDCDGIECGDNGCGGDCGGCGRDEECSAGACVPLCEPVCAGRVCGDDGCGGVCGQCDAGEACGPGGVCVGGADCDCPVGDICLDGACRAPVELCGPQNPVGLCPGGRICLAGGCVDRGAGCSVNNPTGACGAGEACRNGACVALDGSVLCDDLNDCTADLYDPVRNACINVAQDVACSDGNGCTVDACVDGTCVAEVIAGCVAPPVVEPVRSPTNEGDLTLRGTKPPGASVQINGDEAAPESPEQVWSVQLQLEPGENVFEIGTRDRGVDSETVTITVIYDITPPTITVTPDGGIYLDGITVTVSTDEPATVYYTDDGGTPAEWKKQFRSIKRFRVFNDTEFAFRARDVAGNWSEGVVESSFEITGEGTGWRVLPALPEALIHPAAAARGDGVYLVGGSDGLEPQAGAWRFADAAQGWVAAPALPTARSQASLASAGESLFLFGGQDDGVPFNEVMQLAAGGAQWVRRSPMPTTRYGLAVAVVGDFVYALGGKTNGGVVLTTAERYNWRTNTWDNLIPAMPQPRYGHVAVAVGDRIYVIGGENEDGRPIGEVDVFEVGANRFVPGVRLPTPRSFAAAGLISNAGVVSGGSVDLVVAGGRLGDGTSTAIVESFSIDDGVWRTRRQLARPTHAAGGVIWALPTAAGIDSTENALLMAGGLVGGAGALGGAATDAVVAFSQQKDYLRGLGSLPEGRFSHAAVEHNGLFYVFGGRNFQASTLFWAYDPETGRTVDLPSLPSVQNGVAGVVLDGYVYAIGGANQFNNAIPTVRRYDPATRRWSDRRPMITARRDAAAVVFGGEIWVLGGDNNGPQQAVEVYDAIADRWRAGTVLPQGRAGAQAVVYAGEIVLVGGVTPAGTLDSTLRTLRAGRWVDGWSTREVAYHQMALIGDHQLTIFGGRGPVGPSNRITSISLQNGTISRLIMAGANLLSPLDRAGVVAHHGRVYLTGGNGTVEVGPEGSARVSAVVASCFNGVLDGREVPTLQAFFDVEGGCATAVPLEDFDLRLSTGDQLRVAGRVEMYHQGGWHPICDDGWDNVDATVVCRQIFGAGARGSAFGSAVGLTDRFILDDLQCTGVERRLFDCPHSGLYSHNCAVSETALAMCELN